jgi:hypothetical protein
MVVLQRGHTHRSPKTTGTPAAFMQPSECNSRNRLESMIPVVPLRAFACTAPHLCAVQQAEPLEQPRNCVSREGGHTQMRGKGASRLHRRELTTRLCAMPGLDFRFELQLSPHAQSQSQEMKRH